MSDFFVLDEGEMRIALNQCITYNDFIRRKIVEYWRLLVQMQEVVEGVSIIGRTAELLPTLTMSPLNLRSILGDLERELNNLITEMEKADSFMFTNNLNEYYLISQGNELNSSANGTEE